jgi:hypothetical protein
MFANAVYHALAHSPKLPPIATATVCLLYHIQKGQYGETVLDDLNVLGLGSFTGNIWAGQTKAIIGFFIDEKANEQQREVLQMIFSGKAGGFMAEFAKLIREIRGA